MTGTTPNVDTIICGDCLEVLSTLPEDSIDAIVTDPPAGIAFMGKEWDKDKGGRDAWIAWMSQVASECLRVIKPGGHALVWALPRTSHWTGMAWENAGWGPRDKISHVFGSGFPKSLDISKALDKMAGAEREIIGKRFDGVGSDSGSNCYQMNNGKSKLSNEVNITAPATPAAKQWAGWGSAIKPSHEDWWLFRKPLEEATIAANVLRWGTGGLNIDGCRISTNGEHPTGSGDRNSWRTMENREDRQEHGKNITPPSGRFPANLIHDGSPEVLAEFAKAGESKSRASGYNWGESNNLNPTHITKNIKSGVHFSDSGSAARFFQACPFTEEDIPAFLYYAKSSRSERNAGLDRTCTVKLITDNDLIDGVCQKDVNMVAVQLLQKVTSDLGVMKWNIGESGESVSALCPLDSLSTILTEINRIIESRTLDLLMHSLISESTQGVNLSMENGGNLAANVENLRKWILTITNEKTAFALGASRVALKMLSQTSENGSWQSFTNFHSTVKPLSLMRYLCRLITPPGGLILDPFAGSGTTCLAAKQEGFHFIGIEKEAEYAEIARRRIAAIPTSLSRWAEDARP